MKKQIFPYCFEFKASHYSYCPLTLWFVWSHGALTLRTMHSSSNICNREKEVTITFVNRKQGPLRRIHPPTAPVVLLVRTGTTIIFPNQSQKKRRCDFPMWHKAILFLLSGQKKGSIFLEWLLWGFYNLEDSVERRGTNQQCLLQE